MSISSPYQKSDRLVLKPLSDDDELFILELLNTEGWLNFIGDRNVTDESDASEYIEKIISEENVTYWVVHQLDDTKIGVITLIKRAHLPYPDIGFAFLPSAKGNGYAYEASKTVLEHVEKTTDYEAILASTIPRNSRSIRLIEKLGLTFYTTDKQNNEELNLYRLNLDKVKIDKIVHQFFTAFDNRKTKPRLSLLNEVCLDEVTIIKKTKDTQEIFDLPGFTTPREKLLTDGTLRSFQESETHEETVITRNIAQRISQYEKEGVLNGKAFSQKGTKMFQFLKINTEWKICNVIWDDE